MQRLTLLLALLAPMAFGSDIGRQSPCYMSGAFVDCYQPVEHTSMEGPASPSVSGYLASSDWALFNGKGGVSSVSGTAPIVSSGGTTPAISIPAATATVNGYLASGDWRSFNGKGGAYTQGNLTEATSAVLTIGSGTSAVFGSGTTIQVTQSDASHPGYLASSDWALFNAKQPLLSAASATVNGYLASGDWVTFNAKVPATRLVNTTAPITGGGSLATDLTLAMPVSTASANGYLASADWANFNGKDQARTVGNLTEATSAVLTITSGTSAVIGSGTTIQVTKAAAAANGYLGSADWQIFNARQVAGSYALQATNINTTSPLAGGGNLSTDRTLSIPVATVTANGYLASADWLIFNARVATNRTINTTSPLSGGGDLSADRTLTISLANLTTNGYLSSSDWAAFNNKNIQQTATTTTGTTSSSSGDTYGNATSLTLSLTAGTYYVGFAVNADCATGVGSLRLNLATGGAVTGTTAFIGSGSIISYSRSAVITLTGSDTLNTQIRGSGTSNCVLESSNLSGSLTNPDNESIEWATRLY